MRRRLAPTSPPSNPLLRRTGLVVLTFVCPAISKIPAATVPKPDLKQWTLRGLLGATPRGIAPAFPLSAQPTTLPTSHERS